MCRIQGTHKVLIVEDDRDILEIYQMALSCDNFQLILTDTVQEARKVYQTLRSELCAIVLDGQVAGSEPFTMDLAKAIRPSFLGKMIAISNDAESQLKLMAAGCDLRCPKDQLPDTLRRLLACA